MKLRLPTSLSVVFVQLFNSCRPKTELKPIRTLFIRHNITPAISGYLMVLIVLVSSCSKEDEIVKLNFNNDLEKQTVKRVLDLAEISNIMWPAYDLPNTTPFFLIFKDDKGEETIGYLLNVPGVPPSGSKIVNDSELNGKKIYRNDDLVIQAKNDLGPNLSISFNFQVDGVGYFLLNQSFFTSDNPYLKFKSFDNNNIAMFIVHELFHIFQLEKENWNVSAWKSDYLGYPQTKEIIELSLLLSDLMVDAYALKNIDAALTQYVSIKKKQIQIDPSAERLVTYHSTYAESIEGSARYVEHFGALNTIYPTINIDPSHTFKSQLDTVSTERLARQILVQRIPYHVGAIVIKMLIDKGIDVPKALREGETPFTMALTYLNLSDIEYEQYLVQLQQNVDWQKYQNRAVELYDILN